MCSSYRIVSYALSSPTFDIRRSNKYAIDHFIQVNVIAEASRDVPHRTKNIDEVKKFYHKERICQAFLEVDTLSCVSGVPQQWTFWIVELAIYCSRAYLFKSRTNQFMKTGSV